MKQERILSFTQAKTLTKAEIEIINGAGMSSTWTAQPTIQGGPDGFIDITVDC